MALLFDRGGLGIALSDDDPSQVAAVLAGNLLKHRLTFMLAKTDLALCFSRREEDSPAIIGHFDVVEVRPAARIDAHRRAQVDVEVMRAFRPHVLPPIEKFWLPLFERALQRLVG